MGIVEFVVKFRVNDKPAVNARQRVVKHTPGSLNSCCRTGNSVPLLLCNSSCQYFSYFGLYIPFQTILISGKCKYSKEISIRKIYALFVNR